MFRQMIEMLCFLGQQHKTLIAPYPAQPSLPGPVLEVKNTIFGHNKSEALFIKYIRPKAVTAKDFDYGYSPSQKQRFADMSLEPKEVSEKMQLFLDAFSFSSDCSLERRRRQRKSMFDVVFSAIEKHPGFSADPGIRSELFSKIDEGLNTEALAQTDTQWGSLHHVLYGLCSGSDLYHAPLWINQKSRYNFLCFVRPALSLLQTSFNRKQGG